MRRFFIVLLATTFVFNSCDKTEVKPVKAGLEVSGLSRLEVGETITVHNTSVNGTSFLWTCGLISDFTTDTNEDFTFVMSEPGEYNLSIEANGTTGSDTYSERITILNKTTIVTEVSQLCLSI